MGEIVGDLQGPSGKESECYCSQILILIIPNI